MANQYKNKIIYGDQTLIDISDTTATVGDVLAGKSFYLASGCPATGTLALMTLQEFDTLYNSIFNEEEEGE